MVRKAVRPARPGVTVIRFTYQMTPAMERNLAVYALNRGVTKQHVITSALEALLRDAGLDPTKVPTVSITYDS